MNAHVGTAGITDARTDGIVLDAVFRSQTNARSNPIAIALRSDCPDEQPVIGRRADVAQDAQWPIEFRQNHINAAIVVQIAEGCAPVVKGFLEGAQKTEAWPAPRTEAYGLRVPSPIGGFICLTALRETGGTALAIPEADIAPAAQDLSRRTGIDVCPEGGAAWAATQRLYQTGWLRKTDRVVVFNTGTGLKYR